MVYTVNGYWGQGQPLIGPKELNHDGVRQISFKKIENSASYFGRSGFEELEVILMLVGLGFEKIVAFDFF